MKTQNIIWSNIWLKDRYAYLELLWKQNWTFQYGTTGLRKAYSEPTSQGPSSAQSASTSIRTGVSNTDFSMPINGWKFHNHCQFVLRLRETPGDLDFNGLHEWGNRLMGLRLVWSPRIIYCGWSRIQPEIHEKQTRVNLRFNFSLWTSVLRFYHVLFSGDHVWWGTIGQNCVLFADTQGADRAQHSLETHWASCSLIPEFLFLYSTHFI
jgi:hypothetical protein